MNFLMILAVIAILGMVIIAASTSQESHRVAFQRKEREQAPIKKARSILTTNEQMTFLKLRKALPDCFVLTRVAMSALLNSSGIVTKNKINRCCVDFVVLDKDFNIISIVEIDPPNQNGNIAKISERDAMLMEAGYRVIRYPHSPDIERIISDFSKLLHPQKGEQPLSSIASRNNNLIENNDNFFDHDY